MSRRTLKPARARIAALLTAPVLGVGLLTPSAFADTPPPSPKVESKDNLLSRLCQHASEDDEQGTSLNCQRDIAPLVSRFLGPGITCFDQSPSAIECRPSR